MKALLPVKAQVFDPDEHEAWFAGKIPRRLLAVPYGGPIPSPKSPKGVDLDGEWFSERTDLIGSYKALRDTRERLLDWHHGVDGLMKRSVIGKSVLDPEPDEDGWWVETWLNAGEKRLSLIRRLMERGAQLFGSSEAAYKKAEPSGEITEWPYILQTLTTSPQNTLSVLRPAKALLDDLNESEVVISPALRTVLDSLDNLSDELVPTRGAGDGMAKAGRDVVERVTRVLDESLSPWQHH